MSSAMTHLRRRRRRATGPGHLLALAGALALVPLAACDEDDPASPPDDTSSENVQGGTALPGEQPSVQNTNVGNRPPRRIRSGAGRDPRPTAFRVER